METTDVLAVPVLISSRNSANSDDPSSYMPTGLTSELIMRADQSMRNIYLKCQASRSSFNSRFMTRFMTLVDRLVATAISPLSETGAPSWGVPLQDIETFWSHKFPAACNTFLTAQSQTPEADDIDLDYVRKYARLSILRASYYTIMMRAAGEIGPGLTEESRIDTALVYMA